MGPFMPLPAFLTLTSPRMAAFWPFLLSASFPVTRTASFTYATPGTTTPSPSFSALTLVASKYSFPSRFLPDFVRLKKSPIATSYPFFAPSRSGIDGWAGWERTGLIRHPADIVVMERQPTRIDWDLEPTV
jgi:hypothetical protein